MKRYSSLVTNPASLASSDHHGCNITIIIVNLVWEEMIKWGFCNVTEAIVVDGNLQNI